MTTSTSPRFLIIGHAPVYGPRDEIVGSFRVLVGTAETERWAYHLLNREVGEDACEVQYEVVDTRPELRPVPVVVIDLDDEDLPF